MNSPSSTRRVFLGQAGTALGAAILAPSALANAPSRKAKPAQTEKPVGKTPSEITLQQTGWSIAATRFINPPTWTWEPLPGAAGYVVMFAGEKDEEARTIRLTEPRYDMTEDWAALDYGPVYLIAWAVDAQDQPLCAAWPNASGGRRFYKSPDFDRVAQEPLDWLDSVERAMGYLLAPARDRVYDFEGDMPRSAWSCCEDSLTGQRRLTAFPALHYPNFIFTYRLFAEEFPQSPQTPEALRHMMKYGDWLLEHRQPADWRCGLFPFSTIVNGKFEGYIEGKNITLFRAARVGEAMLELFQHTQDKKYLGYARHLADVFVDLQRPNGSWPFRVNPKDGSVADDYTSAAITPARLMGMLERIEPNSTYRQSREKAAQWVLENPVRNRRWQGQYEDVAAQAPYRNLHHKDTNETIWYLIHYHRQDPGFVRIAEELNRFIEDQFVIWRPGDRSIIEHVPTPTVLEQYACYRPMETHTAIWAHSLMALHRATGNDNYLKKAINAGNSIVRAQAKNGAYSTWGHDPRFGRPLLTMNWTGCNASAAHGLIHLSRYVRALPHSRITEQPL